jgi:O-antigen ligase
MMMMGLSLTLLLLVVSRGVKRWLLLLNLVAIAATVARSGSRGGFLGFVAVGVAALILANGISVSRRLLLLIAAPIALGLGAPAGYWKQMGTLMEPKSDYNYSAIDGRRAVAQRGFGYMARYPLFGIGMNNFAAAECTISPKLETLDRTGPVRCTAPHNSYIQAGAELGVPGLIVWVSLMLGVIVMLLKLRRRLPRMASGTEAERFIYGRHFLSSGDGRLCGYFILRFIRVDGAAVHNRRVHYRSIHRVARASTPAEWSPASHGDFVAAFHTWWIRLACGTRCSAFLGCHVISA